MVSPEIPLLFCKFNPVNFAIFLQLTGRVPVSWLLCSSKWVSWVSSAHDAGISPEKKLLPNNISWILAKPDPNRWGSGPVRVFWLQSNLRRLLRLPSALGRLPDSRLCSSLRTTNWDKFLKVRGISPSNWLWSKHKTSKCISRPSDAGISPFSELNERVKFTKLVSEPRPLGSIPKVSLRKSFDGTNWKQTLKRILWEY